MTNWGDRRDRAPLEDLFWVAFSRLRETDYDLFRSGVSERTLCGRLAMYLQESVLNGYPDHRADVEYNRTVDGEKRIPNYPCDCERQEAARRRRIRPAIAVGSREWNNSWSNTHNRVTADLVVHSRGVLDQRADNLIAIEMKKSDVNKQDCDFDRCRLRRMTLPWELDMPRAIGYQFAFFVCLNANALGRSRDSLFQSVPVGLAEDRNANYLAWPDGWGYVETFENAETIKVTPFQRIPVDGGFAQGLGVPRL